MSFLRYNAHVRSGTADGVAPAGIVTGNQLFLGNQWQKVESLSALCVVDAETNTLTFTAQWQVSNDAATWVNLANEAQNPAGVALATGTGGADATVTKALPAPDSIYGYKFARMSLIVGVVTGVTVDTFAIGYSYRQQDPGINY